jgi:nanoRNase/pAp phosphatase (c-di-AMP/oligoRNAs hydrolase)
MVNNETLQSLSELLEQVNTCLVILGTNPSYDQVATSLALGEALQAGGKEVTLISPEEIPSEAHSLMGLERFQYKLGNQSLSIKFPYQAEAVDKVSYHISDDEETFYLMIKPQKGHAPLDTKQVSFDYVGADADMIFLVGVHQFESLDHVYQGFEELYERAPIVTIHSFEPEIGNLKINTSKHAAYSQAMVAVLQHLQLPLSAGAATNLLAGIEMVTDGMSSSLTTAETFDVVAMLLRQGARRLRPHQQKQTNSAKPLEKSGEVVLTSSTEKEAKGDAGSLAEKMKQKKAETLTEQDAPKVIQGEIVDPEGTQEVAQSLKPKQKSKKKKKKKAAKPGGLDYQPGLEGSVGGRG